MAYSTQSDLLSRISEATLIQLTDTTGSGQVDSSIIGSAIADADALINCMISPVYKVPLTEVPQIIRDNSATVAIYKLHLFRSVDPGVWKDAYGAALDFLKSIAEGGAALEGNTPEPPASSNITDASSFNAEERRFSRTDLKEW